MERFVVRKNTLPYIHQWAVIDTNTDKKVGEYKTEKIAQQACDAFMKNAGIDKDNENKYNFHDAFDAAKKRMNNPDGDKPKNPPRHSNKRPMEL